MLTKHWNKSTGSFLIFFCVEVRLGENNHVEIRDSKQRDAALLRFTLGEWDVFIRGVKAGEFDIPENLADEVKKEIGAAVARSEAESSPSVAVR